MTLEQLTQHQATVRGLRDTLASNRDGFTENVTPAMQRETLFDAVDALADVVGALIEERLADGQHSAKVSEMIKGQGKA